MAYNSKYKGSEIDAAVGAVREKEDAWDKKQAPITGEPGQVVVIGKDGTPVAQDSGGSGSGSGGTAADVSYDNTESKIEADNVQDAIDVVFDTLKKFALTIDTVPTQGGSLTFTGSPQSPSWNGYNPETLEIGGMTTGTNAGTYTATFTPKEGYQWNDGSTGAKEVTWTIGRATIAAIPSQSGSLTYDGTAQEPAWSNYDSTKMTLGGVVTGTNAGSYNATFTPGANYQWADGTTAAKTVAWSIGRATISATPAQSGSLTYSGSAQSPKWSNYDTAKLTIGGTSSATNAGSYNATFTPTSNYQWSDGGTTAKTVAWTIGKAAGSLSLNKTTMTLNAATKSSTIAVTRAGDGAVSATSSNTSVATVSVSGTTITVTGKAYGTATITIKVAAGTNHNAPANKTCSVTVNIFNATLNSNSWAAIKAASDAGEAASVWAVGDTKTITINGTVGNFTFSNLSVDSFIIGFNHNSAKEGTGRTHFLIGKISGKMVGLCDSNYNSSSTSSGYFQMNTSNTNSGGWNASYMRKTLLGNSNTPTSPLSGSLMAALPSDLRAVMKSVTKYTDNTGNATNTAACVTATTDYLFLLAEFEVDGTRTYANQYEQNSQAQYDYFKAGNSKIAYRHTATGTAVWVWRRSAFYGSSYRFCATSTDGSAANYGAGYSGPVLAGFAA